MPVWLWLTYSLAMNEQRIIDLQDVARRGQRACELYDAAVERGETHRMAVMLALQQAPRVMTDDVFLSGYGTLDKQFKGDERQIEWITKRAMQKGYTPNRNDVYNPLLVRPEVGVGDPQAFINSRSDIRRICEERGLPCEGAVTVKGREPTPPKPRNGKRLAPDLVEELYQQKVQEDPGLKHKNKREVQESIVDQHGA